MRSMTGYAYKEKIDEDVSISVEIKSWNSRFLDLSINIPSFLGRLENRIREKCSASILRGKVDLSIRVREKKSSVTVEADENAARAYFEAIQTIAHSCGLDDENIPIQLIVSQDGVLSVQKDNDPERYWAMIEPVFTEALVDFTADRDREGANLKKDLLEKLAKIEEAETLFREWIPQMENLFRENVLKRFKEVLGDDVDEQRVMAETAALLVKYTINEEVVRLQSHIDALKIEMESNPAPGKKIDFICQELNREINTIGSKNQFVEVGRAVIAAKDALENIREQARNVE
ncbi:MAG: YicC family protein [Treponemataceae bacterium]|nr:YicC family protein [Treponemataceae bacterium]